MFTLAETRREAPTAAAEKQREIGEPLASRNLSSSSSVSAQLNSLDGSDRPAVDAAVEVVRDAGASLATHRVTLHTTMGDIQLELYWCHAPRTCINFFLLAKRGCYDGNLFHRVCNGRWAQSGDPTGTGRGGASIFGKPFEDEIHQGDLCSTGGSLDWFGVESEAVRGRTCIVHLLTWFIASLVCSRLFLFVGFLRAASHWCWRADDGQPRS